MYDRTSATENRRQTREVATLLVSVKLDRYDANTLALLGGLPTTNGQALRSAARAGTFGPTDFTQLCGLALSGAARMVSGTALTVEEAFARMAALGFQGTPQAVAFHCIEDGCHARAQIMLEQLERLGVSRDKLRRVWGFSERAFDLKAVRMRPVDETGAFLLNFAGVVVEFDYHVAVGILVLQADGSEELAVFDPSLFLTPATLDEWLDRTGVPMHRPNVAQVTELGVAPTHPATGVVLPGGGYWPYPLPPGFSPSQHASREMARFMSADRSLQRPARPLPKLL